MICVTVRCIVAGRVGNEHIASQLIVFAAGILYVIKVFSACRGAVGDKAVCSYLITVIYIYVIHISGCRSAVRIVFLKFVVFFFC